MERPKKKININTSCVNRNEYAIRDSCQELGYNQACDEWEAYLESISEQKLYCAILDVQESLERKGEDISLLQSHRKMMARLIKNMIDGGV